MPIYDVQAPDGKVYTIEGPAGATADQLGKFITEQQSPPRVEVRGTSADEPSAIQSIATGAANTTRDLVAGGLRGAAGIGATLLQPTDYLSDKIAGRPGGTANAERRAGIEGGARAIASDPSSLSYSGAKLGTEIAGTAGVGGALAAPLRAAVPAVASAFPAAGNALARLASSVGTSGMTVGGAPASGALQTGGNALLRMAGGAVTGGASAGLINPNDAGFGAVVGGAVPGASQVAGGIARAAGRSLRGGGSVGPEVVQLAERAKQLGIDIPADRLVNSKPLNAVASSLDYIPFSGRTATMNKMEDQLNTAVSRTFGQDSPNIALALRKASDDLGAKFDRVLSSNTVNVDAQFVQDLATAANQASRELGSDGAAIIGKQVDDILSKAATGQIDGQAAYNIKKTLDRISNRNSPEAFYARDLKQKLMEALDRSLGPQEAAAFAQTRKQYGSMLAMEKIAQNGAEGGVSIARLANMKNINNPELQELADISAQFLKSREGAHGSAQRVVLGTGALLTGGATGTLPAVGAGMALGRGTNMLLNSAAVKNAALGQPQTNRLLRLAGEPDVTQMLYRAAPAISAQ